MWCYNEKMTIFCIEISHRGLTLHGNCWTSKGKILSIFSCAYSPSYIPLCEVSVWVFCLHVNCIVVLLFWELFIIFWVSLWQRCDLQYFLLVCICCERQFTMGRVCPCTFFSGWSPNHAFLWPSLTLKDVLTHPNKEQACSYLLWKKQGTPLVVQWLRISLPLQGKWFQSLVRELRTHMPWSHYACAP